jgi:CheY-like chemotaxis protein
MGKQLLLASLNQYSNCRLTIYTLNRPFDASLRRIPVHVSDSLTRENAAESYTPNVPLPQPALIVALTGLASQRDQDAARAAGADHFFTKPLKLSRLRELLVEWGIGVK